MYNSCFLLWLPGCVLFAATCTYISFFVWLDLLQVGGFSTSFHDPSLQPLVPRLIDLLLESSAANTAQKYSCSWQRWKAWARSKLGVTVLLAISLHVTLYLTEIVNRAVHEGHSFSVIDSAAYSIRWGHRLAGVEPPTGHPLVIRGVSWRARGGSWQGPCSPGSHCLTTWLPILL